MENRREPLIVTALVAGLLGLGAAQPTAEADPRPTLAVVSFKGSGVSPETGDAMADELAVQLVETGRYRVLARHWLMSSAGVPHPSLDTLRAAAVGAGVEYLVFGETRSTSGRGRTGQDVVFIDVRVISVATGEVVRTAAGRVLSVRRRSRIPLVPMMRPGTPVSIVPTLALAAVSASARSRATAAAIKSVERELARIAKSITLPEAP